MPNAILLVLTALAVVLVALQRVNHRARSLEAKLNRLLALQGIDVDDLPAPSTEVLTMARSGKRIEAIRTYRKETFAELKEAKNMIDRHLNASSARDA
jgi:ribosomal protein L7/L12